MSVIKSSFPYNFFGNYDDMTSEYAPGLLKYDVCMTEQVSGPQGTKIAGRHMVMIPKAVRRLIGLLSELIKIFSSDCGCDKQIKSSDEAAN